MGRQPMTLTGLTEAHHLELGMELGAISQALRDVRGVITSTEGSASATYAATTRALVAVKTLATLLDRDLRDRYGDRVAVRKTYREALDT